MDSDNIEHWSFTEYKPVENKPHTFPSTFCIDLRKLLNVLMSGSFIFTERWKALTAGLVKLKMDHNFEATYQDLKPGVSCDVLINHNKDSYTLSVTSSGFLLRRDRDATVHAKPRTLEFKVVCDKPAVPFGNMSQRMQDELDANQGVSFHSELMRGLVSVSNIVGFEKRFDHLKAVLSGLGNAFSVNCWTAEYTPEHSCKLNLIHYFDRYIINLTDSSVMTGHEPLIPLPNGLLEIKSRPTITKEEIEEAGSEAIPTVVKNRHLKRVPMTARQFAEAILELPEDQLDLPIVHDDDSRNRFIFEPDFEVIRVEEEHPHYEADSDLSGKAVQVLRIISEW